MRQILGGLLSWGACCGYHLHRVDLEPIFGCHPGDYIVSISLRVNDMLMLCRFCSLLLIVVFARGHLMFLLHRTIKSSEFIVINMSTSISVNYFFRTWEGMEGNIIYSGRCTLYLYFSNCIRRSYGFSVVSFKAAFADLVLLFGVTWFMLPSEKGS